MKKRIIAVVALVLALVMESVTVFATEYPSPSGYLYGDVIMLQSTDSDSGTGGVTLKLYRLTSDNNDITESNNVVIGIIKVGDAELNELDDASYEAARQKLLELANEAQNEDNEIDGIAFDVTCSATSQTIQFIDSRVVASDKENGLVKVYHLLPSGVWEEPEFESNDGGVTVYFENGFSPVLIVRYSNQADYAARPAISGDAKSPKTGGGNIYPYVGITAIVALTGIFTCYRKYGKR